MAAGGKSLNSDLVGKGGGKITRHNHHHERVGGKGERFGAFRPKEKKKRGREFTPADSEKKKREL